MPTTLSTATNNNQNIYPSANAVLLDNDNDNDHNTGYISPAMAAVASTAAAKQPSFRDQYATAHVVGEDVSPFSTRLAHATETHATATALDPWSKQKTIATETEEQERRETERPTFVYQPPSSDYTSPNDYRHGDNGNNNNNNGTGILPAAALENPIHKKYRRRNRRRGRMVAGGAAGFVLGSILLGPIGAVALGIGGAHAIRAASKRGERRKDRRVQRQIEQLQQQRAQGDLERIVIVSRR